MNSKPEAVGTQSPKVSADRLWARHMHLAEYGRLESGGVNRPAFSPEDAQARCQLIRWATAIGLEPSLDAIGNLFLRKKGSRAGLAPVYTGSHLDTQPTGGKFDGIYGVLAGLEVLQSLHESGLRTARDIVLVVWSNEEGSRFAPTTMGSSVYVKKLALSEATQSCDADGHRLAQVLPAFLAAHGDVPVADITDIPYAYLEAHIEQGPVLEKAGLPLGVVTGIQGLRWFEVVVTGQEAHAGTTPLDARADALQVAVGLAKTLMDDFKAAGPEVRFTIGRWQAWPGSPNTVAGRVVFSIDLRHPDSAALEVFASAIEAHCAAANGVCTVALSALSASPSVAFSAPLQTLVESAAARWGAPCMKLISGATHDAKWLNGITQTAMLFAPCERGISHNPRESAKAEDLALVAQVLAETLVCLAQRP